jgi:hypothetical protein
MAAQVTAMEPAAAAAGEGQRFKRIPRQAWSGNLELDPLVRLTGSLLVASTPALPDLVVRVLVAVGFVLGFFGLLRWCTVNVVRWKLYVFGMC